jgi:hypothetical protein
LDLQQLDQIAVRLYPSRYDSAISVDAGLDFDGERTSGGRARRHQPGRQLHVRIAVGERSTEGGDTRHHHQRQGAAPVNGPDRRVAGSNG